MQSYQSERETSTALQTEILTVDAAAPDAAAIQRAADLLVAGRLVAFPTETVYGLGANALDAAAVERIFAAKGRPASDPLIVHIYSLTQLDQIVTDVPAIAWALAHHFWPGPLTLVLPKHANIPTAVSAGLETVAVRMPNHPVPHQLLKAADRPVAAPSANLFARPSPTQAQHVYDDLAGRVELILDAGPTTIGVESTVLDVTGAVPTVLRPGGLSIEALRAVVPDVVYTPRYATLDAQATPAPGMLLKHYSPNVDLLLFDGSAEATARALYQRAAELAATGKRVGVMIEEEQMARLAALDVTTVSLGSSEQLDQIAATLFASMRQLERANVDVILTRTFDRSGVGMAVWDRLVRATEGRVIQV